MPWKERIQKQQAAIKFAAYGTPKITAWFSAPPRVFWGYSNIYRYCVLEWN